MQPWRRRHHGVSALSGIRMAQNTLHSWSGRCQLWLGRAEVPWEAEPQYSYWKKYLHLWMAYMLDRCCTFKRAIKAIDALPTREWTIMFIIFGWLDNILLIRSAPDFHFKGRLRLSSPSTIAKWAFLSNLVFIFNQKINLQCWVDILPRGKR